MASSADPMTLTDRSSGMFDMPARFFSWWLGELAGLLPRQLRASASTAKSCLVLELRAGEAVLIERLAGGSEQELGRLDDDTGGETEVGSTIDDAALALLAKRRYRTWPLLVRLKPTLGLRKVVELPNVPREELSQLLRFELDRLTPFKAEDVTFAWRVLKTDAQAGKVSIELEMAPKTVIGRALRIADHVGRQIGRIELIGDSAGRKPMDLLPKSSAGESAGWFSRMLQFITLALLIAVILIPLVKQKIVLGQLEADAAVFRQQAEESLAFRQQLDALEKDARFLFDAKTEQPSMIEVMAELTDLLPDNSYLVQMEFEDGTVELSGFAQKASDLIAILDQSPLLTSPQFQSPVVYDRNVKKERFVISVDLLQEAS